MLVQQRSHHGGLRSNMRSRLAALRSRQQLHCGATSSRASFRTKSTSASASASVVAGGTLSRSWESSSHQTLPTDAVQPSPTQERLQPVLPQQRLPRSQRSSRVAEEILLTRQIAGCCSWQELDALYRSSSDSFNQIHLTAILQAFVRVLQPPQSPANTCNNAASVYASAPLTPTLASASPGADSNQLLSRRQGACRASATPMTRSERQHVHALLEQLVLHAGQHLMGMSARNLSSVLWALARLHYCPSAFWMAEWLAFFVRHIASSEDAEELSAAAFEHAAAALPADASVCQPSRSNFPRNGSSRDTFLAAATPRDLATAIWALSELATSAPATASYPQPTDAWMCQVSRSMSMQIGTASSQDLGNLMLGLVRLHWCPPQSDLNSLLHHAAVLLPSMPAQELCNMMWALARWQCLPPKAWLRQLDQVLLSRLQLGGNGAHAAGQAPGQDSSMHRVGKLAMASNIVPMPPRTMGQASHEQMANPTSRSHNAAAALTNSNSLASTGRSAGAAGLKRAQPANGNGSGDAPVRPLQLHLRETATLLWSLTRLRHKPPPALVHALEHAALQHLAHGSPADLAMLVWAFGGLRYNASNRFWAAFLRRTHAGSFVAAARPAELAAWAYGMGRIALPVPLTWAGAFAAQLQSQLPEMSGRGLVGVLKFLAGAQYTLPAQHARGQMPTSHSMGTLDRRLLRRPLEGRSLDGLDELAAASSTGLALHSNVGGNAYLSSPGVAAQQQLLLPRPGGVLRPLGLKARLQHPQQQQVRESVQSPQSQHASTSSRSIVNKNMSAASLRRDGGADPLASAGSIRHCLHAALQHSVAHALSTRNLNLLANAAWAAARARIRMPRSWLAVLVRALSVLLCTSDTLPTPQTTVMLLWSLAKLLPGRNLDSRWRVPALNKGWAAAAAVAASATTIPPAGTAILTLARERQQGSDHAIPHVQFKLFGPAEHNKRLMRQGSRSKQGHRQARRPGQGSGHRIGKMSSQSTTAVTHPNRKQRAERALSAGWLLMRLRARMQEQSWSPRRMLSAAAANNLTTVTASATAFSTATLAGGLSAQLLMTPAALCTGQVIVMGGPDGCRKYATPLQGLHISQRCAYKLLQSLSVHAAELPVPLLRRAVYGVSMLGLSPGHGPAARHAVKGLYSAVRQRVVSSLESAAFEQGSGVEQGGQERAQLEYTAAKVQQWYKAVCV